MTTMHYVADKKSSLFGRLVSDVNGNYHDCLGQQVTGQFDPTSLEPRPYVTLPVRKPDASSIEQVLIAANCEEVYHFTDVSVLPKIFADGFIASRTLAQQAGGSGLETLSAIGEMNHYVTSAHRVQDFARFTVQGPSPIIYHWQGVLEGERSVPQTCMLRVDARIAVVQNTHFSRTNANTCGQIYGTDAQFLQGIPLQRLQSGEKLSTRERGAEMLYLAATPIDLVRGISFRTPGELKQARNLTQGWHWHNVMDVNRELIGKSKGATYLDDVLLTTQKQELDGTIKDDQRQIPVTAKDVLLQFDVFNPKQGQGLRVELFHEGERVAQGETEAKWHNCWTLRKGMKGRGNYEVRTTLLTRDKQEHVLYSTTFEVA